jgi:tetratricopeptide (TPR) repeat protein
MKRVAGFLIVVGALFAAVTMLKRGSSETPTNRDTTALSVEERERIHQFWETYRRATEHRIAGRTPEAVEAYARALALNPEHHDALYYLGNMEFDRGNLAAAEHAWQRLIAIEPTSARAHVQLGILYFCVGEDEPLQPDRATAEFRRAAAINREETGPLLSLGEIALVQGDTGNAQYYFDAVIGSNYSSVEAHFYKGYMAWKSGAPARASALLAAAVSHARPATLKAEAPGEGDTRTGAAPMVRTPTRCGALRAPAAGLAELDADETGQVDTVYRAFDTVLRDVRTRLPR